MFICGSIHDQLEKYRENNHLYTSLDPRVITLSKGCYIKDDDQFSTKVMKYRNLNPAREGMGNAMFVQRIINLIDNFLCSS